MTGASKRVGVNLFLLTFSVLLVLTMFSTALFAAEIGRAQLNGREIILNDDNTWAYASDETQQTAQNKDCVILKSKVVPVSICLDEKTWKLGEEGGAAEYNLSTKDESLFLLVITESAEVPLDTFEKAIAANAQEAAGLKPIEVIVKERMDAFGLEWGRMVYAANIDGLSIKYENFFTTIEGKGAVQFVFYTTSDNYKTAEAEIEKASLQISVGE